MPPPRDHPAPGRTGVLVIRVWLEPDAPGRLLARLLQADDPGEAPATRATAAGVTGVCAAVEDWLERFLDPPER